MATETTKRTSGRRTTLLSKRREQRREAEPTKKPKSSRWKLRLVTLAAFLLAIVWLLPMIVTNTPLLGTILGSATADLDGKLTLDSASLGWFSPIEARGIQLTDSEGQPAVRVERVAGDKTLLAMLLDMSSFGKFRIENPKLTLVLRDGGSNLEQILAEYLKPSDEPSSAVGLQVEIVDGSVTVEDADGGRSWQLDNLQLALSMSAAAAAPIDLNMSADIAGRQLGDKLAAKLHLEQDAEGKSTIGSGNASIESTGFPLDMLDPFLARFAPGSRLAGRLTSKLDATWGGGQEKPDGLTGDLSLESLEFASPVLAGDRVKIDSLLAACNLGIQDDIVHLQDSKLTCDLGQVSLTAKLNPSGEMTLDGLWQQVFSVQGEVDLARLAAMLPNTLRIRRQTRIGSGKVVFAAANRPTGGNAPASTTGSGTNESVLGGHLEVKNLVAFDGDRQLSWEKPVRLSLSAHNSKQGPAVDSLKCESEFLNVHAAGTLDKLAASASFDLAKLASQLGQFVDLGDLKLAGSGWSHFNWKRSAEGQFTTDAELQVRGFQLAMAGKRPWTEENLLAFCSLEGSTDFGADTQLQKASLLVKSDPERLDVRITQPVLDLSSQGTWPLHIKALAHLDRWLPRIEAWMPMAGWRMAGSCILDAQVSASLEQVDLQRATASFDNLQLGGPGLNIVEPKAELSLAGRWNQKTGTLDIKPASVSTTTVAAKADSFSLAMPEDKPISATGKIQYTADLGRLQRWFADPKQPSKWTFAGVLGGKADFNHTDGKTHGQVEAAVDNLAVTGDSRQTFHDPKIELLVKGSYAGDSGEITLHQAKLTSLAVGGDVAGTASFADDRDNLQLNGQVSYDLEQIVNLLEQNRDWKPYLDGKVLVGGSGASPLAYSGPLFDPAKANANAGFGWQWADIYGCQIGPGSAKTTLADGILRLEPMDLVVSGGRVNLAAQVRLPTKPQDPMELVVPPGPLATQVRINQKMCNDFLKYIAPVLADVATAQGSFSIELDKCRIPLSDPSQGELAGRFTVHTIQVGAGPLVRELAVLLGGGVTPGKLRRESVVEFQMVKGRVYHRGLELIFPDLTIRTYGSVGINDQSVAIMAEMPVPPKWIGNNPIGSGLRNQTIRLPIGGTLSKPKIDERALSQASGQFIGKAVGNIIEDEGQKFIENLFDRPR